MNRRELLRLAAGMYAAAVLPMPAAPPPALFFPADALDFGSTRFVDAFEAHLITCDMLDPAMFVDVAGLRWMMKPATCAVIDDIGIA